MFRYKGETNIFGVELEALMYILYSRMCLTFSNCSSFGNFHPECKFMCSTELSRILLSSLYKYMKYILNGEQKFLHVWLPDPAFTAIIWDMTWVDQVLTIMSSNKIRSWNEGPHSSEPTVFVDLAVLQIHWKSLSIPSQKWLSWESEMFSYENISHVPAHSGSYLYHLSVCQCQAFKVCFRLLTIFIASL